MDLFYAEPADISPPFILIRGQEAKHISKVMRYGVSDQIWVTDGMGSKFRCEISRVEPSEIGLNIVTSESEERSLPVVTVCVGNIKKRDRMEFSIEKMTELGVDRIIVFSGDHSQKENVRAGRLETAALAAMKQSLRLFLPAIQIEKSLESALKWRGPDEMLLMADETSTAEKSPAGRHSGERSVFIVIGPEGGFSLKERKLLSEHRAHPVTLGKKRLRTETAAMVAADRFKNLY